MKQIFIFVFSLISFSSIGQSTIIGLGARWSDSFREWELQTDIEDQIGTLKLRWAFQNNWTEWDFRLGDTTATIQQKWKDDPELWEIRALGKTATARTTWRGDFRSWRLQDGTHTFTWKSKYSNLLEEWELREASFGAFSVYTYYEGDPRDWVVNDELKEEISFAMRLAMIFIAVYHSTPKI